MEQFEHISVNEAWNVLKHKSAVLLDIRDLQSFMQNHPQGAQHLQAENVTETCRLLEFDQPLMIICYHGISSHHTAQFFVNYGFEEVYSVDGGFAAWQLAGLPTESGLS